MHVQRTVTDNPQLMHFEIHDGDDIAFLEYRFYKNILVLMHTEVPAKMEGLGIGSALAAHAFSYAAERDQQVKVYCPFVLSYVKRHPGLRGQLYNGSLDL